MAKRRGINGLPCTRPVRRIQRSASGSHRDRSLPHRAVAQPSLDWRIDAVVINLLNLLYIPLAFACWTAPVIGMSFAVTGLFSPKATDTDRAQWKKSNEEVMDLSAHEHLGGAGSA